MKVQVDGKRRDVQFQVGDQVYLKLPPYRQVTVARRLCLKLAPRFYGPFEIVEKLKAVIGDHLGEPKLPMGLTEDMAVVCKPVEVIGTREGSDGLEFLVVWEGLTRDEDTWERADMLCKQFPAFHLEDKHIWHHVLVRGDWLPLLQVSHSSVIEFRYGGDAGPPSPADHLRAVFYRMGLSDKDIVALSGAHTLGRSRPERSGWGKPETKYTKEGPGAPGGQSWTVKWLCFDNSYFKDIKEKRDEDLLVLPTDAAIFDDPSFKVFAEKYAEDEKAFFTDYAEAHAKLSNLGAKFDPAEGFSIDDETATPVGEKFVAAKYSSGKD
uniref:Probable L-ascorbate peroxidase 6, chloroplastic isoform X2 n=1 Tax=Tanacetum cinerariifolium TaxID=118510 RepID=A0A699HN81_TANCI|nr:probable L-ascorbate peroxidase 6, chloroplastic isoform X2 [Tanacetum cinerariifolium]